MTFTTTTSSMLLLLFLGALVTSSFAFVIPVTKPVSASKSSLVIHQMAPDEEDSAADPEGADLAAQLFKMAQEKGVSLSEDDLLDDDEEDEEDDEDEEEDEEEPNIPQGAINAFLGYDTGDVGDKLAGNVSLTDDQLYSEVKERVLDTAGGFVELVGGAREDDDDDDMDSDTPKPYVPPTTVPDSDLTAGEVVLLVLDALLNNDNPSKNKGVEILFGYSSSGSQIKNEVGLTPEEYADFLKETEYKVLFDHQEVVSKTLVCVSPDLFWHSFLLSIGLLTIFCLRRCDSGH